MENLIIILFIMFCFYCLFTYDDNKISKIATSFPAKPKNSEYLDKLKEIKKYFGKLSNSNECLYYCYTISNNQINEDICFGYTKYNGETNRNGTKSIDFCLSDDLVIGTLDRNKWKKYDKEIGKDNAKWVGYSIGEYVYIYAFKNIVSENKLKDIINEMYESLWYEQLYNIVKSLNLNCCDEYNTNGFTPSAKYKLAGAFHYLNEPIVALGFAKPEPSNPFNNKAVAIYTDKGIKVGYVAESELKEFRSAGEEIVPVVIETHYYKGHLYGFFYPFNNDKKEYGRITSLLRWQLTKKK